MAVFDAAIGRLLEHEGGYVNDPADPGGETRYGISKRAYPEEDIANLTVERAKELYRRDYWDALDLSDIEHQRIAAYVFDMAVNMGPERAVKVLQAALNALGETLARDGKLGPATRGALGRIRHVDRLLYAMISERGHYYVELTQVRPKLKRFFGGWILRAFDPLVET